MRSHDDVDSLEPHSCTVVCHSVDHDSSVLRQLEDRYRVISVSSVAEMTEYSGSRVDALVVDAGAFDVSGSVRPDTSGWQKVPVVVVAGEVDPRRARSVARRSEFDLVYRDTVPTEFCEPASERLHERVDAACRSVPDLEGTILELAGLLMSAEPDEVEMRIEWGLQSIGQLLGADRAVLYDAAADVLERRCSWAESAPLPDDSIRITEFPGYESSLERFDPFVTVVGADSNRASSLGYGPGLFVAIPVVVDWDLEWVLTFGGVGQGSISQSTISRLETFGGLIGHTLRRDRRHREIERQNERLERFASVIRHDLQNPLNVITGFTELARESDEPVDVDRIGAAASRMEAILDDLHTLVREADELGEREPVAVSEFVDRASRTVEMANATIETEEIGVLEADPGRLQQVFENVFRNAVEHGGSDVSIRITAMEDGFAIEDDGPGIPADDRERIFEEGYTAGGGSGLGLSIVRTIVDAHGWSVSVTESPSGGARFEITGVEFLDEAARSTATA
jgi:two-component sensor histidine kinase